jgi:hypothetical protein
MAGASATSEWDRLPCISSFVLLVSVIKSMRVDGFGIITQSMVILSAMIKFWSKFSMRFVCGAKSHGLIVGRPGEIFMMSSRSRKREIIMAGPVCPTAASLYEKGTLTKLLYILDNNPLTHIGGCAFGTSPVVTGLTATQKGTEK